MKRCIGQRGQCLLCYYGLSLRTTPPVRPYATFYKSTVREKRPRYSARREAREERWVEEQLSRVEDGGRRREDPFLKPRSNSSSVPTRYKGQKSIILPADADERGQVNILKRLEKCISQVWDTDAIHGATDAKLLDDLDPKRELWKKHVDNVRQVFGLPESHLHREQQRTYSDLTRSLLSEDWRISTIRLLKFSFLDKSLHEQGFSFHQIIEYIPDMQNPTEWYPQARQIQRQLHLHVGPTNSGKTYNALKKLEEAGGGYYAGPLRLLAHEVYSRFLAKGIPCDLVTGDDVRLHEDEETMRTSSTVEMVNVSRNTEIAVIDEIQMIADDDRGWAWTRALLGSQARELHLCGEERVVPLIQELAATMGDNLKIHRYERLNPLKVTSRSLRGDLQNLRKGDCVVSFSVMSIHAMKKQIEKETGRRAAIVYGSLPPETRAQQAALFNDPDNDYDFLVASDAIGMGLNLSIKRIIFESINKFNGYARERISVSQIKQIAGRAGRYRTARDDANQKPKLDISNPDQRDRDQRVVGLVSCLDEKDLPIIRDALSTDVAPIKSAGILPPGQYIEEFSNRLPQGLPFEYLFERVCKAATVHPRYKVCDVRSQLGTARALEPVKGLTLQERFTMCASPADPRTIEGCAVLRAFAKCIVERSEVTVADIPELPLEILDRAPDFDRAYLSGLEVLHKSLVLFLWLGYRFSSVFKDMAMAFHAKELAEEKINFCLTKFSANPKLRQRLERMRTRYILPLQSSEDTAESPETEATSSTVDEAGKFTSDMQGKAPTEDESELELAVEELGQIARESNDATGPLGEPKVEIESDGAMTSGNQTESETMCEDVKSPRTIPEASDSQESPLNLQDGGSDPNRMTSLATETKPPTNPKQLNDNVSRRQGEGHWNPTSRRRPVLIPTEEQLQQEDKAANASR